MLGLTYLKRKFGGDKVVPANEQFYSPLRIGLHSTIEVGMVDWLVLASELNKSFVMPTGSMSVLAIGTIITGRNKIFNIYALDEAMEEFTLQLFCSPNDQGQGLEFREGTLFREALNISPQSEDEWEVEMADIGNLTYKLDDLEYKRIWGGESVSRIEMESFSETIIRLEETLNYTNSYVLYGRELSQYKQQELLVVGVEETDNSAELVNRIGLSIPRNAINVQ